MTVSNFRRNTACVISLFHLLTITVVSVSTPTWAQQLDSEPPIIEMEVVTEGVRGETQVFSATVTDNIGVSSVTFHYRYDGDDGYSTAQMTLIPNTSVYTTSVESGPVNANAIEYYVEARDGGDNRTLQGFSFDPLDRAFVSAESIAASAAADSPLDSMSTNRKIIYGVLGVLVVGALAASAGGSSGGSSGGPGPLVQTEIFVEPFQ